MVSLFQGFPLVKLKSSLRKFYGRHHDHLYVATFQQQPAYGVYISQMIRYSRVCGSYQDFIDRGLLLTKATESRVPFGKVEVITSKILRSPP